MRRFLVDVVCRNGASDVKWVLLGNLPPHHKFQGLQPWKEGRRRAERDARYRSASVDDRGRLAVHNATSSKNKKVIHLFFPLHGLIVFEQ